MYFKVQSEIFCVKSNCLLLTSYGLTAKYTYSVILLAKLVDVLVSYHVISCLRTARRNILRTRAICLEAAIFNKSTVNTAKKNWNVDSAAEDTPNATESSYSAVILASYVSLGPLQS